MLLLNNDDVARVLTMKDTIDIQDQAFRGLITGSSVHRPRIDVYVPTDDQPDGYYRWGTMEGASKDLGVFAIRMKSDVVYWPEDENGNWTEEKYCVEPGTFCGLVFLFSTRNGEPLALMNEGNLQHMRVGGGGGLGVKYLSREDSHTVGMIGSGGMARTYLQAFCEVRDIRSVRVYSPTKANREAYALEMSDALRIDVEPVDNAQDAVRGADIVSTCTGRDAAGDQGRVAGAGDARHEPGRLRDGPGRLRAGQRGHQAGDLRAAPSDEVQAGRGHSPAAYVAGTAEEQKRLPMPLADSPMWSGGSVIKYPTFMDLVSGKAQGRTSRDDITLYVNGGNQGASVRRRGLGRLREGPGAWPGQRASHRVVPAEHPRLGRWRDGHVGVAAPSAD